MSSANQLLQSTPPPIKLSQVATLYPRRNKIVINSHDSMVIINARDIAYIKAEGNYSLIITLEGKKVICSKPLSHYCSKLEQTKLFFRVHHAYLVNTSIIREWHSENGLILEHVKETVPVSRRNKSKLKILIQRFCL